MGEEKMALRRLDWDDLLGLFWGPKSQRHGCQLSFGKQIRTKNKQKGDGTGTIDNPRLSALRSLSLTAENSFFINDETTMDSACVHTA